MVTCFDTHQAYTRLTEEGNADPHLAEVLVDVFGRDRSAGLATKEDLQELEERMDKRFTQHREWTLRIGLSIAAASVAIIGVLVALLG